ncbi:adenosine kinase-like protein [Pyronema omphalodes]|nr:adenosine kinase-like protein [Pyronema omphalodes]
MAYPLFCLGNPLLDIQATCDESMLKKYNLDPNGIVLVQKEDEPKYQGIYEDLQQVEHVLLAGGAAQNAARGAQYVLPADSVVYVGCVGNDKAAEQLRHACSVEGGVRTEYLVDTTEPTGRCGVVITGDERSLVTQLAAANNYKVEHLQSPEIWKLVEAAKVYYVGGFHLTVCPEAILKLAEHAAATNKIFSMNLSAPFLCHVFKKQMDQTEGYWDYLIANESEALAYAGSHGIDSDAIKQVNEALAAKLPVGAEIQTQALIDIARHIAALPKVNTKRPRVVVFTQGTGSTVVVSSDSETASTYPVRKVAAFKDSNGAGDAFAGGFLGGIVLGEDIETAVSRGQWLASLSIQELGPAYPKEKQTFVKA